MRVLGLAVLPLPKPSHLNRKCPHRRPSRLTLSRPLAHCTRYSPKVGHWAIRGSRWKAWDEHNRRAVSPRSVRPGRPLFNSVPVGARGHGHGYRPKCVGPGWSSVRAGAARNGRSLGSDKRGANWMGPWGVVNMGSSLIPQPGRGSIWYMYNLFMYHKAKGMLGINVA